MTVVKICGLTNLEDAQWAWRCGADMLGFILVESSPRYIAPPSIAAITQQLSEAGCAARYVGVTANSDPQAIGQTARACGLHIVQWHAQPSPGDLEKVGLPVILAHAVRERIDWEVLERYQAWAYLLDTYDPNRLGGVGRAWRWELLASERQPQRVIVAGGLDPANVAAPIRQARPWGVDVSSGVEAWPGRKDPAKVAQFIQAVREEDGRGFDPDAG
jgi:phosphoribosylanthranilate isomerase